jgi:hypothetical protein
MSKYRVKHGTMTRVVCFVIAGGMILSALASGVLMFF